MSVDNDDVTETVLESNGASTINIDDTDISLPFGSTTFNLGSNYSKYNNVWTTTGTNFGVGDITLSEPSIKIGKYTLNEHQLERLEALITILEDDPEWSEKINTQIAFNRLRGE